MKTFLLRSVSNRFPLWAERSLHDLTQFHSLGELIRPDISEESVLLIAELYNSADAARVMLWRDWHRELLLANATKVLLLVATKEEAVYRSLNSHGIEMLHFPFQERSLIFKVALQERLLKSTRSRQVLSRPKIPNGPDPNSGTWTLGEFAPSGKTRWRWIQTKAEFALKENRLELCWQAEAKEAPLYVESAWQLNPGDKLECHCEGERIFSLHRQEHSATASEAAEGRVGPQLDASSKELGLSLEEQFAREEMARVTAEQALREPSVELDEIAQLTCSERLKSTTDHSAMREESTRLLANHRTEELSTARGREEKNSLITISASQSGRQSVSEQKNKRRDQPSDSIVASAAAATKTEQEFDNPALANSTELSPDQEKVSTLEKENASQETETKAPSFARSIDMDALSENALAEITTEKLKFARSEFPLPSREEKIEKTISGSLPEEMATIAKAAEVGTKRENEELELDTLLAIRPQESEKKKSLEEVEKSIRESDLLYKNAKPPAKEAMVKPSFLDAIQPGQSKEEQDTKTNVVELVPKNSKREKWQATRLEGDLRENMQPILPTRNLNQPSKQSILAPGGESITASEFSKGLSRLFILKSLKELDDRNSSWERADKFRVYLSAADKYEGIRELGDVLSLWIYQGELAPEFIEETQVWKFYDRGPTRCEELDQLPVPVRAFLKELIRPRARSKKEKRRAWAKEKDLKKFYRASGEISATEPIAEPEGKKERSFLQALLHFIGLAE